MSKKPPQVSSQYLNIRNQNKNEILEDYVEAIQEISELKRDVKNADLAEHFGVSQATINKNLKRLINFNLAESEPYRSIFLTKEGKKLTRNWPTAFLIWFSRSKIGENAGALKIKDSSKSWLPLSRANLVEITPPRE